MTNNNAEGLRLYAELQDAYSQLQKEYERQSDSSDEPQQVTLAVEQSERDYQQAQAEYEAWKALPQEEG